MVETIKDRLKQLAKDKGLSIRSFEETCGLGRGNVSNMSQDGSIGSDKLSKIFDTFPDTDLYWLLTGEKKSSDNRKEVAHQADTPTETPFVTQLLDTITQQAEEIGRLKARIEELERRRGDNAGHAQTSENANVG